MTGTSTGFTDFDQITTGLHEDNLIIIAARPAMGKTAFTLDLAQNVARIQISSGNLFTRNGSRKFEVERMLSAEGLIPSLSCQESPTEVNGAGQFQRRNDWREEDLH